MIDYRLLMYKASHSEAGTSESPFKQNIVRAAAGASADSGSDAGEED